MSVWKKTKQPELLKVRLIGRSIRFGTTSTNSAAGLLSSIAKWANGDTLRLLCCTSSGLKHAISTAATRLGWLQRALRQIQLIVTSQRRTQESRQTAP